MMNYRNLVFILAAALIAAAATVAGQVLGVERVPPRVLSGADVGFRVEGIRGGRTPVGTLVVRIKGEWIEAEIASVAGVRPGTN